MTCNCIEETDKALAEHGLCLDTIISFSPSKKVMKVELPVPVRAAEGAKPKIKLLVASYCPFCGKPTRDDVGGMA